MAQWRSPGQQDASACFSIRPVSTEQVETSETQFTGQTKIKKKSEQQDCTLRLQSKIALFLWHLITPCREDCLVFQSDALNFTRQYFTVQIYPCVWSCWDSHGDLSVPPKSLTTQWQAHRQGKAKSKLYPAISVTGRNHENKLHSKWWEINKWGPPPVLESGCSWSGCSSPLLQCFWDLLERS